MTCFMAYVRRLWKKVVLKKIVVVIFLTLIIKALNYERGFCVVIWNCSFIYIVYVKWHTRGLLKLNLEYFFTMLQLANIFFCYFWWKLWFFKSSYIAITNFRCVVDNILRWINNQLWFSQRISKNMISVSRNWYIPTLYFWVFFKHDLDFPPYIVFDLKFCASESFFRAIFTCS